jgi:carbamoyl-phosphate synthase large subunit
MKLLLTSVGSLVAQSILDVLDYPGFSRRALVQIIGTNSIPDAAGNFLCDRSYLVPPTLAAEYPARMRDILLEEAPDLIFCCRDEDTYALARLKNEHPDLPGVLPIGSPHAALIGLDKWQTALFAGRHGLPFAESFMPGESGDGQALEAFCRRVGYPLVAKPSRGFGSRGVCFIRNADDAQIVAQQPGYLFQEYVGDPRNLDQYFVSLHGPPPLFAQFKDSGYSVSHTIIAPNGTIAPIVVTENKTTFGYTSSTRRIAEPTIDALTMGYARALFLEGGTGPLNIQVRQNLDEGTWKAVEINLRTSSVLARFQMGVDQLCFLINAFVPGATFPELRPHDADRCDQVGKQYYSHQVIDSHVSALKRFGVWSRA